ncbi:ligase-associated DNA damage response DEXH box helicase [Aestuariivirga litoralis]|uniref:Ligase-associated DNA damage response DEXH box helicase n=1 Tax=Aestuariivirga litoralis TaxID=2650924 RepID=A0A2W2CEQ3_9HYPH|nr:ligase-associated DNA damage response DEXH box helicase [Aestuariivirga litoralis]PZF78693.1 ligase-associated DNA damage response DEXH box helicase [Aestuariivirga litoralis]
MSLPQRFLDWFSARGWAPRAHQLAVLDHAQARESVLLISPTGGGKTLAGFLPSLAEITERGSGEGIHTLYISPLKALAVDIARNLEAPIAEMKLPVTVETRTGDTPHSKRQRQRQKPPDILITTPEQVSLLVADPHAAHLLKGLRTVILDELHSMVTSKRGVLLSLALTRVQSHAPEAIRIGLSATVADPDALRAWLASTGAEPAPLVLGKPGAKPEIRILSSVERVPWSGHSSLYAIPEVYEEIKRARMTLIFVNTRSQAEMVFQALWEANDDNLPIALHHGSLDVAQRRKVEAAMGEGKLRAVVCTSTLELGIDWGDVDLVVHVGAPKGSSRLLQRIGRSNHKLDLPSQALLVPSNRFEVLECTAALQAAEVNAQDTEYPMVMKLDVLAQHILGRACAGPFHPDELFGEVSSAWTYRKLTRVEFDKAVDYVATGGYALRAYERYAKLKLQADGTLRLAHPRLAMAYRLNMGTIVEDEMLKVRLAHVKRRLGKRVVVGGRVLGEVEEWFVSQLTVGQTFVFAGEVLRFEGLDEFGALATRSNDREPMVPSYQGGKFPLSTYLAERVRQMLADPKSWKDLPPQVRGWLSLQRFRSVVPKAGQMLVETFPRADKHYMVCYPFEGRLAHQTLGMLLTRRLERAGMQPLGFVASEYALVIWMVRDLSLAISSNRIALGRLFDEDMMGDDLEAWMAESALMKRTFRNAAIIAGLIERRQPGKEKTARQMTVNTDLIYDVLRTHEPDHLLLRAAWDDAAEGLIDAHRLGAMLRRIKGQILHKALDTVSPLSVPILLDIGRESVYGEGHDALLAEAANALIDEAMRLV